MSNNKEDALPRALALLAEVLALGKPFRVQVDHAGLRGLLEVARISETAPPRPRQEQEQKGLSPGQTHPSF